MQVLNVVAEQLFLFNIYYKLHNSYFYNIYYNILYMVGGLLQLTAKGAQDIYLTGNPQITFFKVVYRRYTNFSIESVLQTFDSIASDGGTITSTIARKGDLLYKLYMSKNKSKDFKSQQNILTA